MNLAQDPLNSEIAQSILKQAVSPSSVHVEGAYTAPRTWGVYEIQPPPNNRTTRRYRIGNHPVRQRELEAEFGAVKRIALFASRTVADNLQRILNAS